MMIPGSLDCEQIERFDEYRMLLYPVLYGPLPWLGKAPSPIGHELERIQNRGLTIQEAEDVISYQTCIHVITLNNACTDVSSYHTSLSLFSTGSIHAQTGSVAALETKLLVAVPFHHHTPHTRRRGSSPYLVLYVIEYITTKKIGMCAW